MHTLSLKINAVLTNIENRINTKYNQRIERLKQELDKTSTRHPIIDASGRFHAPFDGYKLPDLRHLMLKFKDQDVNKQYLKGEFLPIPIFKFNKDKTEYGHISKHAPYKIKLCKTHAILVLDALTLYNVHKINNAFIGTPWYENDHELCYLYLGGSEIHIKELNDILIDYEVKTKHKTYKSELDGKQSIIGTIVKRDVQNTIFGQIERMHVLGPDGVILIGTIPSKLVSEQIVNKTISFCASFTKHSQFFKRPHQVRLI